MKMASLVLRNTWLFNRTGNAVRWLLPRLPHWLVYSNLNVWGRQRDLPEVPKKSFRQLYRQAGGDGRKD